MIRAVHFVGAVSVGAALLGQPADAQRPGAVVGRFEVPGLDWGVDAAWRVRARQVRELRQGLMFRRDVRALNGAGALQVRAPGAQRSIATAVTGSFFVPVVAIQYQDVDVAFPTQSFQDVLFATTAPLARPYTLKTYYEELSRGRITMEGKVFEPVRVDSTAGYYQNGCNGIGVLNSCDDGGQRFGDMLISVLDSISNRPGGDSVWTPFDNDGPDGIPNSGDDDGEVDFVTFLQPVKDGACSGSPGVWAHRWFIRVWNGGSKYQTQTPRRDGLGNPIPGQFIVVDSYTIQSQIGGTTGCQGPLPPGVPTTQQILPVGTIAHETGHAFGLPDLYDTSPSSGTEGAGEWSIMGSGNYARAYSPASYDPWSLAEVGWITVDTLSASRTVATGPRQLTDTVFYAPTSSPTEYLLVENRQAAGSDTAMMNPANMATPGGTPPCLSNCRKVPGLMLWHIDQTLIDARRFANTVNTGSQQGVEVIQADGLNQLRSTGLARNRGDHGDPFPGVSGVTAYTLRGTPAARLHAGGYAGFIIDQIQQQMAGVMSFRFLRRDPSLIRGELTGALIKVGAVAAQRYEDVIPPGDQFTISADSLQFVSGGRTKALFLQWSLGGPRTQTVTSSATPDTIVASFSAEHRVLAIPVGTGTGVITSPVAGDLSAGAFVAAGTSVTLTAVPGAGNIFGGWRGDTTAADPELTLPMHRPYDVEAIFSPEVSVAVADATTEILGTPILTVDQKIFLDLIGNRNGFFDLGDYLALLRRNGQTVSPDVLRAAQRARGPR